MSTFDDAEALEDAAGAPHPRRTAWIWGWAGVAVLVAIAAWFGWGAAQQPVRWQDVSYSIDSPTQVTVVFEAYLYTEDDATCYLRALNARFAEVGVDEVAVRRADGTEQRITASFATTEEATTAVVKYCTPAE